MPRTLEQRSAHVERQRRYNATCKGRAAKLRARQKQKERHPEACRAHDTVKREIRSGRMTRGSCETCGAPNAQAHHEDYSRPLDVRWLCQKHHSALHWGTEIV